jgi:exopolysaccharide biosynthesis WecB/TagA/CpsF family protein
MLATAVEPPAMPETVRILGVPVAALSFAEAALRVRDLIASGGSHQIVLANAHTLNLAWDDPAYRRVLTDATLVLRDGIGLELASRIARRPLQVNFVGTDFVPALLGALGDIRPRVFLYGAAPGTAEGAARALEGRCPGIRIVGTEHGFGDATEVVARVRAARPDVLLVALGNPVQEAWIARHLASLDARVAIGVGALFDFLSGKVRRAPAWVRAARCEWIYRLALEPARMWHRYVVGNPRFLWRVVRSRPWEEV